MSEVRSQKDIYHARVQGTNVNVTTLLATDYLNHFNEALMLAELVIDMPDMLDDFISWTSKSYIKHFEESEIADRELAIESYEYSPLIFRRELDATVNKLDASILELQALIGSTISGKTIHEFAAEIEEQCLDVRSLIDIAGAIINGQLPADNICSSLLGPKTRHTKEPGDAALAQGDIDALFG